MRYLRNEKPVITHVEKDPLTATTSITKIVHADEIYNRIKVPADYEWTGEFRVPLDGELYLSAPTGDTVPVSSFWKLEEPRIILRKKQPQTWTVPRNVVIAVAASDVYPDGLTIPIAYTQAPWKHLGFMTFEHAIKLYGFSKLYFLSQKGMLHRVCRSTGTVRHFFICED